MGYADLVRGRRRDGDNAVETRALQVVRNLRFGAGDRSAMAARVGGPATGLQLQRLSLRKPDGPRRRAVCSVPDGCRRRGRAAPLCGPTARVLLEPLRKPNPLRRWTGTGLLRQQLREPQALVGCG